MTDLLTVVRREIVEIHDFFTDWFNGSVDRDQLEVRLLSRLHPDFLIISPAGDAQNVENIRAGFPRAYGTNTDFRIQVRDVEIRQKIGSLILATYTEWQTGARDSGDSNNARLTTVLLEEGQPIIWRHIHETSLPASATANTPFDF